MSQQEQYSSNAILQKSYRAQDTMEVTRSAVTVSIYDTFEAITTVAYVERTEFPLSLEHKFKSSAVIFKQLL